MSAFIEFESVEDNEPPSEDDIEDVAVEVKVEDEPIIQPVVTVATTLLSTKVNAMLQNAFVNSMFFNATTKFSLGLTSLDAGTSRLIPVFFTTEEDPTKRNTFVVMLRATDVNGKHAKQTDRRREALPHTQYNNASATSNVSCAATFASFSLQVQQLLTWCITLKFQPPSRPLSRRMES